MRSAVLIIFFNRPNTLEKVFEKVREAQPPKLFLVQDGPRPGNGEDVTRIEACRKIVENVDWDCEVYRNYSECNLGCGLRPQSGISWVLSQVESSIILEDDCVPEMSFFTFCDEMLERYKDDERICYISGLNHFEEWDFGDSSYGFTKGGSIWGWATWERAWKRYDYAVNGITNSYVEKHIVQFLSRNKSRIGLWKRTNELVKAETKLSYWDVQWGFVKYSQNQLVIVPKYNLISHIGIGADSTHAAGASSIHRRYKDYNNMAVRALEFPLAHPAHMLCDTAYDNLLMKCNLKARKWIFLRAVKNKIAKLFRCE